VLRRVEDMHGLDVLTAVRLAVTRIREAYENGYDEVELVHGAPDVREPVASQETHSPVSLRPKVRRPPWQSCT
jgi:hypothetical protein